MTDKDNKLAEEIYFDLCDRFIDTISREQIVFMAMQAYHTAKLAEITDEDIEAWADGIADAGSLKDFERGEWLGIKEGAKAFRDGEIKWNREV